MLNGCPGAGMLGSALAAPGKNRSIGSTGRSSTVKEKVMILCKETGEMIKFGEAKVTISFGETTW